MGSTLYNDAENGKALGGLLNFGLLLCFWIQVLMKGMTGAGVGQVFSLGILMSGEWGCGVALAWGRGLG